VFRSRSARNYQSKRSDNPLIPHSQDHFRSSCEEFSFWRGIMKFVGRGSNPSTLSGSAGLRSGNKFVLNFQFMSQTRVVIIGAGEIGGAIEFLMRESGCETQKWDADPAKVPGQKPLEGLVPKAQAVFFCVPSWVLRDAISSIQPLLKPRIIIFFLSKGIAQDGKTVPELAEEMLHGRPFALLSGPMLAEEIIKGLGGVALAASTSARVRRFTAGLFAGSSLRIETSSDVKGTAFAAVLKNIYSIGLGIADGLGWGANKKGWLAEQAILEMQKVLPILGGKAKSVFSPAGVADFIATGFSQYSSNREIGDALVRTGVNGKKSEGYVSLPRLAERLSARIPEFPLFSLLQRVCEQHEDAKSSFAEFFRKEF